MWIDGLKPRARKSLAKKVTQALNSNKAPTREADALECRQPKRKFMETVGATAIALVVAGGAIFAGGTRPGYQKFPIRVAVPDHSGVEVTIKLSPSRDRMFEPTTRVGSVVNPGSTTLYLSLAFGNESVAGESVYVFIPDEWVGDSREEGSGEYCGLEVLELTDVPESVFSFPGALEENGFFAKTVSEPGKRIGCESQKQEYLRNDQPYQHYSYPPIVLYQQQIDGRSVRGAEGDVATACLEVAEPGGGEPQSRCLESSNQGIVLKNVIGTMVDESRTWNRDLRLLVAGLALSLAAQGAIKACSLRR